MQGDNNQRFISQCDKLNKLRNDLIHNFVSLQKSGIENISDLLNQVDRMIEGANNWNAYKHGRVSGEILKSGETKDNLVSDQLHIRTHEGDIRDDLPIDGLIEICNNFYQILKQLKISNSRDKTFNSR